jgi:5-methylcytosine-specific restriction endonuclease McrA
MKKLPLPIHNDERIIATLAENRKLTSSYPYLKQRLPDVKVQYQQYIAQNGNPFNLTKMVMSNELKTGLISNYNSPPKELKYIETLRNTIDDICAMCGSKFPWSLDHILPKDDYPEWAVFSKNLVPACRCNITRGKALLGDPHTQARVLHPYFDDVFDTRQLSCLITTTNNFRWINLELRFLQPEHPQFESIKFHVKKVVKPAGIEKYLQRTKWSKMTLKPSNAIRALFKRGILTVDQVAECIAEDLDWYDEQTGTPNNWDSVFLHGLLNSPGVANWITAQHNASC